ncbi:hypothetical protein M758_10G088700 [Ceratodon purpureus]|nr:hypothetical protein M758_10G088700 [Ceratodon purpureus]
MKKKPAHRQNTNPVETKKKCPTLQPQRNSLSTNSYRPTPPPADGEQKSRLPSPAAALVWDPYQPVEQTGSDPSSRSLHILLRPNDANLASPTNLPNNAHSTDAAQHAEEIIRPSSRPPRVTLKLSTPP